MFQVKFKFPQGNTVTAGVNSVPKVGEICRMENDSSSSHYRVDYRVGAVWHNIWRLDPDVYTTSIDVMLDLP